MLRSLSPLLLLVLLGSTPAFGWQGPAVPEPGSPTSLQAPPERASDLRDAGVYHIATGTWTRRGNQYGLSLGALEALYRNDAGGNYFTVLPDGASITDQGRIPGTGSQGDFDSYRVRTIDLAYCTGQNQPLTATLSFFESYVPCTDPGLSPTATVLATGLPSGGSGAGVACWLLTLDLTGTTQEFDLAADGGDGFDDNPDLDSFGMQVALSGHGADLLTGPLRAGDPLNAPFGAGTRSTWGFPAGPGTGLGQADQFWLSSTTTTGCLAGTYPVGPYNGIYAVLKGEPDDGNLLASYPCPPTANSTGLPALITATGSASMADGNFLLRAAPVGQLQPGIFFYGPNQILLPFGNGIRCVGGQTHRLPVVSEAGGALEYEASARLVVLGAVGSTINIQAWYRDSQGGGLAFNLSDAGTVTIEP